MIDEKRDPYREDIAAYALGALDADDIPALEQHLETCMECQAELEQYRAVSDGMLQALPPQLPPSGIRRRLQARLETESAAAQKDKRPARSFGQVAWGAAFALLLALNLFTASRLLTLERQQRELASRLEREQTAVAMLAYPSTQTFAVSGDIQGVAGSLLADPERRMAVLFVWNLPVLEAGQTYQVWLIDAQGNRTSGGLFVPSAGETYTNAPIRSPEPLSRYTGIGVTVEPAGGSPGPTGARVLKVDF